MADEKEPNLFAYTFEIKGQIPEKVLDLFVKTQAKMLGLRGYIKETSQHVYEVYIEGEKGKLEQIKNFIMVSGDFIKSKAETVFQGAKEIKEYTQERFERK